MPENGEEECPDARDDDEDIYTDEGEDDDRTDCGRRYDTDVAEEEDNDVPAVVSDGNNNCTQRALIKGLIAVDEAKLSRTGAQQS